MSIWVNADGLTVKFPGAKGDVVKGGAQGITSEGAHLVEFIVDYTDALSATAAILGSASASTDGGLGVMIPKGAWIEEVETIVLTAFTSSGTIGSATLEMGTIAASDRTTAVDADALTTTSFVGGALDALGEKTVIRVGSTGAGSGLGAAQSANGYVAVRNSAHGSHPFTAGKLLVRVKYTFRA